ncbi:hypothetical protein KC19_5G017400 [Ceratodon purpureus]|uniref:Uncharacterized protein n=1 Tax=Ceratodon purpureus TaxID=3225 RepID=A0A8T0HZ55_CERPU|nr:hypothetical protein KC19_5G017400 [Ceratodon purpureus]
MAAISSATLHESNASTAAARKTASDASHETLHRGEKKLTNTVATPILERQTAAIFSTTLHTSNTSTAAAENRASNANYETLRSPTQRRQIYVMKSALSGAAADQILSYVQ